MDTITGFFRKTHYKKIEGAAFLKAVEKRNEDINREYTKYINTQRENNLPMISYQDYVDNIYDKSHPRYTIADGGSGNVNITKQSKKTIFGKERCIYAIQGDRKEYLRYKGDLIPVKDYKKLMKDKK
jgi:hypothetical protein